MITIYGSPRTSAGRCFWVLEEIGQPYEVRALEMFDKREHKTPEFLSLNPNGKVPCLVDGDYKLWESTAINHYLADTYKPELLGTDPRDRGLVQQWTTWAMLELQPPLIDIFIQMVFTPEPKRDLALVERAREKVPPLLRILDEALAGRAYLVGDALTLADLNVASVANIATALKIPTEGFANVRAWLARLHERPSFKKMGEMRKH